MQLLIVVYKYNPEKIFKIICNNKKLFKFHMFTIFLTDLLISHCEHIVMVICLPTMTTQN